MAAVNEERARFHPISHLAAVAAALEWKFGVGWHLPLRRGILFHCDAVVWWTVLVAGPPFKGVSERPQAYDPNLTPAATAMSPIALLPLLKRRGVACLRLASSGS